VFDQDLGDYPERGRMMPPLVATPLGSVDEVDGDS
jgi:hypothetical protein